MSNTSGNVLMMGQSSMGVAATVQNGLSLVSVQDTALAIQWLRSFLISMLSQAKSGQSAAESMKESAHEQAQGQLKQAIGTFVSAGLEGAGVAGAMGMDWMNTRGISSELKNIDGYLKTASERLKGSPDIELKDFAEDAQPQKDRMKFLTKTSDYSELDVETSGPNNLTDKQLIMQAKPDEAEKLVDRLEELKVTKNKALQNENQKSNYLLTGFRAAGQFGSAGAQTSATNNTEKKGEIDADQALFQLVQSIMQSNAGEYLSAAGKLEDQASQLINSLPQMMEADIFRG